MIGHVSIGASFYHLIRYVLEDKKELSEEQKKSLSLQDGVKHRGRAEVLEYNRCFGDKNELTKQFNDVQKLSRRVEKPVLHLSLRLAPGEQLNRAQLAEIGQACAAEFGIADHQYICVLHKDTKEQHIHIAANRVGFDGRAVSDSNNYRRMAAFCRRMENRYSLQKVLSPRAFLPAEQRSLPRHDKRKEKLRQDISHILSGVNSYADFEQRMKACGYQLIKGRGISFMDDKKVKVKGSEVGFSLAKIEKILALQQELSKVKTTQQLPANVPVTISDGRIYAPDRSTGQPLQEIKSASQHHLERLLEILLKPEQDDGNYNYDLQRAMKKKKKRKYLGH
ncbi:relaxase/mobilization nuclease domain-containing protein [Mucilaginibacter defluvii]|uniref:MobA/VirD2-like nuclease domain-containing protein n=1 Tax=Mucilaginibacter defluvii TaxID=1196019 RepID=A0ABP9G698_9SPHI